MIERLSVKNFKSWADLPSLEFGKVTALFGANSSGKTSLIQLLLMLKQTAVSRDRRILNLGGTPQDYVDLGGYEDIVHGHKVDADIDLDLSWTSSFAPDDETPWISGEIKVTFSYVEEKVTVKRLSYSGKIAHEQPYFTKDGDIESDVDVESINASIERLPDGRYSLLFPSGERTEPIALELPSFYTMQPLYLIPGKNGVLVRDADAAVRYLSGSFEELLNSVYYLGPLREYPHRDYRWSGEKPSSVGVRGEYAVQAMLSKLVAEQSTDLVESANQWLKRLGMVDQVELRPIAPGARLYELVIRTRGYQHEANIMDVGFGVSQVLPVLVLAHFAPPGSLLILEQPEIHLHPQVQTELADLFLEAALKRNVQFFIESHSEYLLMRLQRRLAERRGEFSQLSEKDVKLYFCKREAEASVLEPLEVDEFGRIKNWPQDFFGDAVAERRAMAEAMIERQPSK
jgi:predicted ATPase